MSDITLVQLCPLPPGWRRVYAYRDSSGATRVDTVPIVALALVDELDDEGNHTTFGTDINVVVRQGKAFDWTDGLAIMLEPGEELADNEWARDAAIEELGRLPKEE